MPEHRYARGTIHGRAARDHRQGTAHTGSFGNQEEAKGSGKTRSCLQCYTHSGIMATVIVAG
jgi:hypothetical protein